MSILETLAQSWEARGLKSHPTDTMLINLHVRELREAITALSNQGEGAVAVYGMRRKGETAIIGVIPAKVHQNPANSKDYLRDYEEVPLYLQPAEADRRDAERWQWARKMENREAAANYFAARMNVDAAVDAAIAATQENGK